MAAVVVLSALSGVRANVMANIASQGGDFYAALTFNVDNQSEPRSAPGSVAVSDFNGDGKADLAVGSNVNAETSHYGKVNILLGNGDGTFQLIGNYNLGISVGAVLVTAGKFNSDNHPDLVATNRSSSSDTISVLLGNGDGTFQAAVNYSAGAHPWFAAVGDFNGDMKPDLAVANKGSDNVSILPGEGDGTFQMPFNTAAGTDPDALAAADFNGDMKLDLVVTTQGDTPGLSLLIGNGDGTFQPAVSYSAGGLPQFVIAKDLNGDTKPDLALAVVASSSSGQVRVMLGLGDGTFQPPVDYGVGLSPVSITTGDYNNDSKPDLVVANSMSKSVSVLLNAGNGAFQAAFDYYSGNEPQSVSDGDFDGDGQLDILVVNRAIYSGSVILGNGNGTFRVAPAYSVGRGPSAVIVGDFNDDNKPDLAVASPPYSHDVSVLLGHGDGTFQNAVSYVINIGAPMRMTMGDFNGDTKPDLAVTGSASGVSLLFGNGDGTFQPAVAYPLGNNVGAGPLAAGDINGDGQLDLAIVDSLNERIVVLLGIGDGTFQSPINFLHNPDPSFIATGYFNDDTKLDLAVAHHTNNRVKILIGNGNGTFTDGEELAISSPNSIAVGDFNGDLKDDLVVGISGNANGALVMISNNDGTFHAGGSQYLGLGLPFVAVADFNHDDKLDIAASNYSSNEVSVLLGNGDGTIRAPVNYGVGLRPTSVAIGDFNRDGKPDIAATNELSDNVSILLNDPVPSLSVNDVTVMEGNAGTVNAVFTVSLSAPTNRTVSLRYATATGTATKLDYEVKTGTLTFAPGQLTQTITAQVKGDKLDEPDEFFSVNLGNATNALIVRRQGRCAIKDDDRTPTLKINNVTLTEGNAGVMNATFTVSLSAASGQTVSVNYATTNAIATAPSDYLPRSGTLTFAPGQLSKTIAVQVKGDTLREVNENFKVNLSSPVNATIVDGLGIGMILNND